MKNEYIKTKSELYKSICSRKKNLWNKYWLSLCNYLNSKLSLKEFNEIVEEILIASEIVMHNQLILYMLESGYCNNLKSEKRKAEIMEIESSEELDDEIKEQPKTKIIKSSSIDSVHKHTSEDILKISMNIIECQSYHSTLESIDNQASNILSILKTSKAYTSPYTSYVNRPNRIYEPLGDLTVLVKTIIQKQYNLHPPNQNPEEYKQFDRYINKLLTYFLFDLINGLLSYIGDSRMKTVLPCTIQSVCDFIKQYKKDTFLCSSSILNTLTK